MEKILYLKKVGATDAEGLNDVGSTRVHNFNLEKIKGEKGEITVEFSRGWTLDKKGNNCWLYVSTYYYDDNGQCWGIGEIEEYTVKEKMAFTKENILKIVNMISLKKFDKIEII